MVNFRDSSRQDLSVARLETPSSAGYRHGMSATRLIGDRLAGVYEIANDVPGAMDAVLRGLDSKLRRSR